MVGKFHFNISLTVLNSLGRDLYRSVNTILGEAISNAWDADAHNIHIYINREENYLIIKDDGAGMNTNDFQNKFLKIGYSKRNNGQNNSPSGRPYIGRKGIGKLALLSCSEKIHIITKTKDTDYIGAIIDNTQIDIDIKENLDTNQHILGQVDINTFDKYISKHQHGTIFKFDNLNTGIKNQIHFFKKLIALYYRFSLIDDDFNIYLNDDLITTDELNDLVEDTQILWTINDFNEDPLVSKLKTKDKKDIVRGMNYKSDLSIKGFIASVAKPSDLKMRGVGEKLTIDLFVNGRMREKDILRHILKNGVYESYLYGQIHYDDLDDEKDRFTSSREGIKLGDDKFEGLMEELRNNIMSKMRDEWDKIRRNLGQDGDPDNTVITQKQRKAESLYNEFAKDYYLGKNVKHIEKWIKELSKEANFNISSYTECFIAENLIRKYINEKSIKYDDKIEKEVQKYKEQEIQNKNIAGINIEIRQNTPGEHYLDMDNLAKIIDKPNNDSGSHEIFLTRKAKEYKPIRDAIMHTSLLTQEAKRKLTTVYDDIKARILIILKGSSN